MSSYLVFGLNIHSRKFDRNQSRVLYDWFDFFHRCFFHSCWSGDNQAVIPPLSLHATPHCKLFNDHYIFNTFFSSLFVPNPAPSFFGIDFGSSYRLFFVHHHNPNWLSKHVPIQCVIDYRIKNKVEKWNKQTNTTEIILIFKIEMYDNAWQITR